MDETNQLLRLLGAELVAIRENTKKTAGWLAAIVLLQFSTTVAVLLAVFAA